MAYERIISLVPSLTELLIDLGLKDRLYGRTRFCVHPEEEVGDIPIVGGTKSPHTDKIREHNPDLIIANKEENEKEHIDELQWKYEVMVTDINTIEDSLITIHEIGQKLEVQEEADKLASEITDLLDKRPEEPPLMAAYLIWRNPWMAVGKDTYINDVMHHWNLHNVFSDKVRYPEIKLEELGKKRPHVILLSSEPYPFKEKHIEEIEEYSPGSEVLLVNGEWFSWYGSRMKTAFQKLNTWRKAIA